MITIPTHPSNKKQSRPHLDDGLRLATDPHHQWAWWVTKRGGRSLGSAVVGRVGGGMVGAKRSTIMARQLAIQAHEHPALFQFVPATSTPSPPKHSQ